MKGNNNNLTKSKSIKTRLLIVSLICVQAGVFLIGAISSYLTRDSLLAEMRENGFSS